MIEEGEEEGQKKIYYFSYGSNNLEQIRERLNNDHIIGYKGYLKDYYLTFGGKSTKWNGGVASILPNKFNYSEPNVYGTIYEITERELNILDSYEGIKCEDPTDSDPKNNLYRREIISVKMSLNNDDIFNDVEAYVYIKNSTRYVCLPSESYVNACKNNLNLYWSNKKDIIDNTVTEIKELVNFLKIQKHNLI